MLSRFERGCGRYPMPRQTVSGNEVSESPPRWCRSIRLAHHGVLSKKGAAVQPFVDSQPADRPTLRVVGSHEDVPTATPEPIMAHPKSFSAGLPVTGAWQPGEGLL